MCKNIRLKGGEGNEKSNDFFERGGNCSKRAAGGMLYYHGTGLYYWSAA